MKKGKTILSIVLLVITLVTTLNISSTNLETASTSIVQNKAVYEEDDGYQGLIIEADKLVADTTDLSIIKENTKHLQECIDEASNLGGGKVKIPSGTYYFAPQKSNERKNEDYVIKARSNVIVEGGEKFDNLTILKPYGIAGELTDTISGGIDMFYYNEYADSNFENTTYLENADFRNFTIDGENAGIKGKYNSSGKGFMLNLAKDCDLENITVKNTSATGIGIDCPINCTITNCIAINCGVAASKTDVGGSGFGISHGYDKNESIVVKNCTSIGNKKYGFFVGHMSVYFDKNSEIYSAEENKGIVISNCMAEANMYDFGGVTANDVTLENCLSNSMKQDNIIAFRFDDNSRRIHIVNCTSNQKFDDVKDFDAFYYEPVYWALNKGITNGISEKEFAPYETITAGDALRLIWRFTERDSALELPPEWFEAECTRIDFIHYLILLEGSPYVEGEHNFVDIEPGAYYENDINWAVNLGIVKGTSTNTFSPDKPCSRAEAITFLYRYAHSNTDYSITYNLDGGEAPITNYTEYTSGTDEFELTNPTKEGYTFVGWTGSSYSRFMEQDYYLPKMEVKINKTDCGNKTYTANWVPNSYLVSFNSNGGAGTMSEQYFIYDDVPQPLLKNEFKRTGYVFAGWNTKADGTGIAYNDEEVVKNLSTIKNEVEILYAQWKPLEVKYKVEHYKQNLKGTYPLRPNETEIFKALADTKVTPSTKRYAGYSIPTRKTVTVAADGSTVVKYYYKKLKNTAIITIVKNQKNNI